MTLQNQTILITGASRGLGAAIARKCVAECANVILHYGANAKAAQALQKTLGSAVLGCVQEDLRLPGAGMRLWEKATKLAGPIHGLVNNAGIDPASQLDGDIVPWRQSWADNLAVNLMAPAELSRFAIGAFRKQSGGIIINIASRAGIRGDDINHDAYAASKGAILAHTRTLARALAGENILCYAIAPGWINTDMAPKGGEKLDLALSEIPLGRMAEPEEIASLTVFLLSGTCPSATGATFDVNGASYVR
ncbi:MAG: 3-oxoacyl-ACP reductase [Robiginitomaculum sp.]|nr:MAG: 3-oxoacyl-ACP reductase [Robiginitomaculum sp.]